MISEAKVCIICGGKAQVRARQDPYRYFQCKHCRSSFLNPIPSNADLNEFYERYHDTRSVDHTFGAYEARSAADFPAKLRLVQQFAGKAPGKILDVGCGKGYFVELCRRAGYEAFGIDMSKTAVKAAADRRVPCRSGLISEQSDWKNAFDVVTCFATIEHVARPYQFLCCMGEVLKPGGWLFLDTGLAGDFAELWAPGHVQWYGAPRHIFVFSIEGLTRLLKTAGFSLVFVDRCFERSTARKLLRLTRNILLSLVVTLILRLSLGRTAFAKLREEAKLPWGNLVMVVARKDRTKG